MVAGDRQKGQKVDDMEYWIVYVGVWQSCYEVRMYDKKMKDVNQPHFTLLKASFENCLQYCLDNKLDFDIID